MLMAKIMRILRSKIVLTGICSVFIFYLSVSYLWAANGQEETDYIGGGSGTIRRPQEFKWFQDDVANDTNNVMNFCRNSVQGKVLIADDQGYVCLRADLYSTTGCCKTSGQKTQRYSCETCNDHGCCSIYEYCVSCCLHPDKKVLLKRILGLSKQNPLLASVSDHFELCLVKCRTSSQSVQHETHYRDPKAKHCYGEGPPPIVNPDT